MICYVHIAPTQQLSAYFMEANKVTDHLSLESNKVDMKINVSPMGYNTLFDIEHVPHTNVIKNVIRKIWELFKILTGF
jgi:hypothetical protein